MSFNKININKLLYSFITIHLVLWTLIPSLTNNNLPLDTIEALAWGSNLDWGFNKHPPARAYFPEIFNVTLAKVINNNLVKVKVWERGAGLTKACGTAACATAVAGNINGLTDKKTDIEFALGKLSISIDHSNSIHMRGPVSDIKNIEIKI